MRWWVLIGLAVAVWWFFFRHRGGTVAGALERGARMRVLPGGLTPASNGGGGPLMFPRAKGCGCR